MLELRVSVGTGRQVIPYSGKFSRYKISRIRPDPRKQQNLIPSKISHYTVISAILAWSNNMHCHDSLKWDPGHSFKSYSRSQKNGDASVPFRLIQTKVKWPFPMPKNGNGTGGGRCDGKCSRLFQS